MRPRDEAKESVVRNKALEILVKEGLNGFSMQKLAKAASVSPATLYIYYKDKDDLIIRLGIEEGLKLTEATFMNFDPYMHFAEGLKIQWTNRVKYWLENPASAQFLEQLKHSTYKDKVFESISKGFREKMSIFVCNATKNNELMHLPLEVFWTIAFAPLYNLIRFHLDGKSIGNHNFTLTENILNQTFDLVIKALTPLKIT